jgi:hypothetical protein
MWRWRARARKACNPPRSPLTYQLAHWIRAQKVRRGASPARPTHERAVNRRGPRRVPLRGARHHYCEAN